MKKEQEQESAKKYEKLKSLIKGYQKVAVGFSGGTDSTFLLKVCCEVLDPDSKDNRQPAPDGKDTSQQPYPIPGSKNVLAVTAESPLLTVDEKEEAFSLCEAIGAKWKRIIIGWEDMVPFIHNPPERCYLCKKIIFAKIKEEASEAGIKIVCDGSNADDALDYRPGEKALRELGVISPLKEAGLTKQEIRELSRALNLKTWDKPAAACLASRIPYDEKITPEKLACIEKAEKALRLMGFRQVRVRHHGSVARIEIPREERRRFMEDEVATQVEQAVKEAGFQFVALDLSGYRMGSLNQEL